MRFIRIVDKVDAWLTRAERHYPSHTITTYGWIVILVAEGVLLAHYLH